MEWAQHGRYELSWHGDILVARYIGLWNEVAAEHLHKDALELWQARGSAPWALLSDGREWEGGSKLTLETWWLFFADAVEHGMIAVTDILPTSFHKVMVSPIAARASQQVPYTQSRTVEEAIEWLNQQLDIHNGLSPSTDTHKQQQR
jgi:hypothetical protein